jgi:hypothetical protein
VRKRDSRSKGGTSGEICFQQRINNSDIATDSPTAWIIGLTLQYYATVESYAWPFGYRPMGMPPLTTQEFYCPPDRGRA